MKKLLHFTHTQGNVNLNSKFGQHMSKYLKFDHLNINVDEEKWPLLFSGSINWWFFGRQFGSIYQNIRSSPQIYLHICKEICIQVCVRYLWEQTKTTCKYLNEEVVKSCGVPVLGIVVSHLKIWR